MVKLFGKKRKEKDVISRLQEITDKVSGENSLSSLLKEYHRLDKIIEEMDHPTHLRVDRLYGSTGWVLPIDGISNEENAMFLEYIKKHYIEKRQDILEECKRICKEL